MNPRYALQFCKDGDTVVATVTLDPRDCPTVPDGHGGERLDVEHVPFPRDAEISRAVSRVFGRTVAMKFHDRGETPVDGIYRSVDGPAEARREPAIRRRAAERLISTLPADGRAAFRRTLDELVSGMLASAGDVEDALRLACVILVGQQHAPHGIAECVALVRAQAERLGHTRGGKPT